MHAELVLFNSHEWSANSEPGIVNGESVEVVKSKIDTHMSKNLVLHVTDGFASSINRFTKAHINVMEGEYTRLTDENVSVMQTTILSRANKARHTSANLPMSTYFFHLKHGLDMVMSGDCVLAYRFYKDKP